MAVIPLVRQHDMNLSESDKEAARRVIFGVVDGLGDKGKKQWRRLWNSFFRLEPGEMVELNTYQERLGWYHKKHMALEQALYAQQERFETFDAMRVWLKVGAGFVEWFPGPKGGVIPVPKSISYAKLEQGEMELVHNDIVAFLRTPHAIKTLWPHLKDQGQASEMMESVLGDFNE
jgi:hypothetical protein